MKKVLLLTLSLVLLTSAVFAGSFGVNVGANVALTKQLDSNKDVEIGYGASVDIIGAIGRDARVEFALGERTDFSFSADSVGNLIISELVAAGVNINISRTFSAYIMPGLGLYVYIGGDRKENGNLNFQIAPLGVGLMSGIRFNVGESGFIVQLSGSLLYPIPKFSIKANEFGSMLLSNVGLGVGFQI